MCRIKVIDNRPKESRHKRLQLGLFICNHQSFADVPVNLAHFQIPPIMKKEVLYLPLIGYMAQAGGSMPFDRTDVNSRKKILEMCKARLMDNLPVQYYPEGTRSKNNPRVPKIFSQIKTPLLKFAYEKSIPVTCVSLFDTEKIFNKFGMIVPFRRIGIYLHHPLVADKEKVSDVEFAQQCWQKVHDGYEILRQKIELKS